VGTVWVIPPQKINSCEINEKSLFLDPDHPQNLNNCFNCQGLPLSNISWTLIYNILSNSVNRQDSQNYKQTKQQTENINILVELIMKQYQY